MSTHIHKAGQPCLACRNGGRRSPQQQQPQQVQQQWQPQQDQYAELQSGYEGGPMVAPYRDEGGYAVPAPRQPRVNAFPNQRSLWDDPEPQGQYDDFPEQNSGLLNRRQGPDVLQDFPNIQSNNLMFTNGRFDGPALARQRQRCLERLGWSQFMSDEGERYWYNSRLDRWQYNTPTCPDEEYFSNRSGLPSLLTLGFLAASAVLAMRVSKNI